jgi:hypothetical protein
MNICATLAAKEQEKKARCIERNLALATEENSQFGLPAPFRINGIWLVPLGTGGQVKPIGPEPWRRPSSKG